MMSIPEPMRCIHPVECPSPMRCNDAGGCIEAQRDGARSYTEALEACRKAGRVPKSWDTNEGRR